MLILWISQVSQPLINPPLLSLGLYWSHVESTTASLPRHLRWKELLHVRHFSLYKTHIYPHRYCFSTKSWKISITTTLVHRPLMTCLRRNYITAWTNNIQFTSMINSRNSRHQKRLDPTHAQCICPFELARSDHFQIRISNKIDRSPTEQLAPSSKCKQLNIAKPSRILQKSGSIC